MSGVAALVRSRFPELTAEQVVRPAHRQRARRGPLTVEPGRRGLVDPVAALTWDVTDVPVTRRRPRAKPVAAPPEPAREDTTPRTIAFAGHRRARAGRSLPRPVPSPHDRRKDGDHHDRPNRVGAVGHRPGRDGLPVADHRRRWILGVAVAVVLAAVRLVAGQFVTTMVGRRLAVWRRNHSKPQCRRRVSARCCCASTIRRSAGLPLPLVAGYVDRYGIRCDKVRVTSRDAGGARTHLDRPDGGRNRAGAALVTTTVALPS